MLGVYGALAGMVFAFLLYFGAPLYHLLHGLITGGFLDKAKMVQYNASNETNLIALYTAMMEYHESEGQFPNGAGWMDALRNRIKADNMEKSEAFKKFINP